MQGGGYALVGGGIRVAQQAENADVVAATEAAEQAAIGGEAQAAAAETKGLAVGRDEADRALLAVGVVTLKRRLDEAGSWAMGARSKVRARRSRSSADGMNQAW